MNINDTIVAISTPIGEAGIGIVRLSGKKSLLIADKIFKSANHNGRRRFVSSSLKSGSINYGWIVDRRNQNVIDEVLLTIMKAPKTYTREDIIEVNCHSGIVPLKKILDLLLSYGARLAEPGEFTRRAFLNGRIDLSQAESVLEIIRTRSESYHHACVNRMSGGFSRKINKLNQELFDVIAQCEAQIDFPEEDTAYPLRKLLRRVEKIENTLKFCLKSTQEAKVVREGLSVAICGRANVGKSSLLNVLINEERSIVTPYAGTTRDAIEASVCFDGIPMRIFDTAGLRRSDNPVEKVAVRRSEQVINSSNLILLVFDSASAIKESDLSFINKFRRKRNVLVVLNKIDLPTKINQSIIKSAFGDFTKISAFKMTGLDKLKKRITRRFWQGRITELNHEFVVNARQENLLLDAVESFQRAFSSFKLKLSLEIIVEDLKRALSAVNKLCGRSDDYEQELLDTIFSQFCIGK